MRDFIQTNLKQDNITKTIFIEKFNLLTQEDFFSLEIAIFASIYNSKDWVFKKDEIIANIANLIFDKD